MFGAGRAPVASSNASDVLPVECATILAGASFAERSADGEGDPRIIVTVPGGAAFRYGSDTASTWLREQFGLNDAQLTRALRMLHTRFAEYQRLQTAVAVDRGERWSDWKPIRSV